MPVFNAEPYLTECLQSIIQQSYPHWELLAVNDFSTDQSYETLLAFAKLDPRIQPLQNQEKGIIPALRLAFAKCKGTLITRMDADDKMHPQKLALLQQQLHTHGPGHVSTGLVKYFSEQSLGGGYQRYEQWLNSLTLQSTNYTDIYRECVIPSPAWMVFATDLRKAEAFQPDVYPEDYDLCFRFYREQLKVLGVPEVVHYWRDYPERTSRNDPNYADALFLDLKLKWFLELDFQPERPLFIWGAGKKGKYMARYFADQQINFWWVCNQSTKWGHQIHGTILQNFEILKNYPNAQVIIAVAKPEDQKEIKAFFSQSQLDQIDYYFFC